MLPFVVSDRNPATDTTRTGTDRESTMAKTTERTWNTEDARIAPAIERIVAEDTYRKGVQTRTTRRLVENVGPAVAVLRFGVGMSQTDVSEALKTEGVATINQNTIM